MTDEGNTADLGAKPTTSAPAKPAGRKMFIAGIVLGVSTYIIGLCASIASEGGNVFNSVPAQIFGVLGLVALISLSTALIIAGSNARQMQKQLVPLHAQITTGLAERARATDRLRILMERHVVDSYERYTQLSGSVAVIPGRVYENTEILDRIVKLQEEMAVRVARIEKVVAPESDFVSGVELGMQLGRSGSNDGRN